MFEDCDIKIDRAKAHTDELARWITEHHATHPAVVDARYDDSGHLAHLGVSVKGLPRFVSALIGDAVHNLRTSLDILAVQLVNSVSPGTRSVHFPFATNADQLEEMIVSKKFDRAGADAVALLRKWQPFTGGNADLRGLHDLDLRDKHNAIIPVAMMISTPKVTADTSDFHLGIVRVKLVDGSNPEITEVFPEDTPFPGEEVVGTLRRLHEMATAIVADFRAILPESSPD
ncbi:hypothetical protein WEU32_07815 [Brevundimonas sp. BH3]|uniref:hypothetical protein n=1 Tax=Brevundimonas sp. BH3 TaxID=3133089 RepID=UPI00324D532B